jgi:MFS family permease
LGKFLVKYGGKIIILISNAIILIGTVLLTMLNVNSSLLLVIIFSFIMGFGFGGAFTTLTIVIQTSVGYNKRGAATATNSLLRTLGQTIGVSIFGGIFNLFIVKYFNKVGIKGIDPGNLYTSSSSNPAVTSEQIKLSLNSSTHFLFWVIVFISAVCLVLTFAIPKNEGKEN